MSQLSQHRQRAPSLGIMPTYGQPPLSNARPSPLSSHPPTPVDPVRGNCADKGTGTQQSGKEPSTWSLPFGSPSNSDPTKHPSNFSTPDLSKSASPSIDSLFRQDTNSFAGSSPQLHQIPLAYQLNNHSTSSKLDVTNLSTSTMSSHDSNRHDSHRHDSHRHDSHRHDSFGSSLPVPTRPANNGRRRSISMQKLFSLSNLKSGFTNSRTSLVSTPSDQHPPPSSSSDRPASNSTTSSRGIKRPAEQDYVVVKNPQDSLQPPLRKRKSSSWFRRKSRLFDFNSHSSALVDDYDMPQGPDAMVMDDPQHVRPTTEHTHQTDRTNHSDSSSERPTSLYTTQTTQQPPVLPPLSPMSKTQTQSSQYSHPQRPASHRTFSSQSRVSRSSSQNRTPYSPANREPFSPPPTLPELTRIETSFGDSDMGELFAQFGR